MLSLLHWARGLVLQPRNVRVARRWDYIAHRPVRVLESRDGSGVKPLFELCVPVRVREDSRADVIVGGQVPIELRQLRLGRVTSHVNIEIARADRVRALVPEQHRPGRTRIKQVVELEVDAPGRASHPRSPDSGLTRKGAAKAPKPG